VSRRAGRNRHGNPMTNSSRASGTSSADGEGLSNRPIAAHLVIAPRAVKHMTSIGGILRLAAAPMPTGGCWAVLAFLEQ